MLEWVNRNSSCFSVEYGSLEWESWRDYFEGIGYMPRMFSSMHIGGAWTAPAQWASQFDMALPDFPRQYVPHLVRERQWTDEDRQQVQEAMRRKYPQFFPAPGSKASTRRPGHSDNERREAQAILDRHAAAARQQPQEQAAE